MHNLKEKQTEDFSVFPPFAPTRRFPQSVRTRPSLCCTAYIPRPYSLPNKKLRIDYCFTPGLDAVERSYVICNVFVQV